jgi:hypothetical protein
MHTRGLRGLRPAGACPRPRQRPRPGPCARPRTAPHLCGPAGTAGRPPHSGTHADPLFMLRPALRRAWRESAPSCLAA